MRMIYALYKGDTFLFVGTKRECALYLGVKEKTISWLTTPTYNKRIKNEDHNRIIAIKFEDPINSKGDEIR